MTKMPDLEAEMYQLSHLLTEQRGILASQQEMALFGSKGLTAKLLLYINASSLEKDKFLNFQLLLG